MPQSQKSPQKNLSGKERRSYQRYPLVLEAELIHSVKGNRAVLIKDYCIGGMYIELVDLALFGKPPSTLNPIINDELNLVTNVKNNGAVQQLNFTIKVMRVEQNYIGVSFIAPDISEVQKLHKFAVAKYRQNTDREDDFDSTQTVFNGKSSAQILMEAHQLVAKEFLPLMNKFHKNISQHFFKAAQEASDSNQQNLFMEAVSFLENNQNNLTRSFAKQYENKVKTYSVENILHEEEREDEKEISLETLSLVEEDDLDDWLSISSIITNADNDNREVLFEIEHRTSILYQAKIDKKNNPFGPAIFAQAFQNAIDAIDITHDIKLVCYTIFRDIYLPITTKLYQSINKFLIDNDVFPVLKFKVNNSASSSTSTVDVAPVKEVVEDNAKTSSVAETPNPENTPPVIHRNIKPVSVEQRRAYVNSMHQQQPNIVPGKSQGILDIFSDLSGLQQNLTQVQAGVTKEQLSTSVATSTLASGGVAQYFSLSDLLEALSSKQLIDYDHAAQSNFPSNEFKEKIQNILANKADADNKVISAREGQIIDVASNVFSSLMNDFQVAESIRPWIKQVEIPALKMAILDDSVFTDTSHIVREVINKISELEVLADRNNASEQKAIDCAFDWLVKAINEGFNGTPKVFERIAQQLDVLIKIQVQAFDKNLKIVVYEFLKEDEVIDGEIIQNENVDINNEWARRVSRLEEGDWVLFDVFSEKPIRLKVGWIARRKDKFVFVNILGKKEKILTVEELINSFKDGETVALDGAEEPAMDRAQYSMLQKMHKQLLYQSSHDLLTGLINRREFETCLEKIVDDAKINSTKHVLCYIDLDDFSVINNSCGYEGGEALIKEVSEILKKYMPENAALSRFNDDEFYILLCGYGTDDALDIVEEILQEFNNYHFIWDDKRQSIAMSVGLVLIKGDGQNASKLLQDAKATCGHGVQVYHEEHARLNKRNTEIQWAAKIDKALDDNALHLRCQRIKSLFTDDSDHYEILLGITDELGKQSSLQEFICAAKNNRRMVDIDRWVIKTAFQWIADNTGKLKDISSFSINLSGHSLNAPGLMAFVMKQMNNTHVPIEKICFEITETLGIARLSDATDFIKRFKTIGCKFSLDDFGSGMSSYVYLKNLPVDYLKIDGAFVKNMTTNPNDYAVVKSISEIGHFMGKKIIAEYVQNDETIQLLRDLGVDYAQGSGVEKPCRLDEVFL